MIFDDKAFSLDPQRQAINALYRADEAATVEHLLEEASVSSTVRKRITEKATALVELVRRERLKEGGIDAFMAEYELSSEEGVVLMCLAEALLRIPDADTADRLIRDKVSAGDWQKHLGQSGSLFVNASTWGLMLTGRILRWDESDDKDMSTTLGRLIARGGEPVIRRAMYQAMRIMGKQFVLGRTIEEALNRAKDAEKDGYTFSYDMLGEAARTMADAERYFDSYASAIAAIGQRVAGRSLTEAPGISIKLSALHPRYEVAQRHRVLHELAPRVAVLLRQAKELGLPVTIDAEEADRLDISLDVLDWLSGQKGLRDWPGLGLALQAYQKRAPAVIDWLAEKARQRGVPWMVRLVKGAYWDSEIKRGQERGLEAYPVFTRKESTDVSYVACARKLLEEPTCFYPQFATHNALTLATVMELAGNRTDYEFQRLHGMGDALYKHIMDRGGLSCRVYAPVGSHEDLLPYLVRRLLENGANSSFVNRIVDEDLPIADLVRSPVTAVQGLEEIPNPRIKLPKDLYSQGRINSVGHDLSDYAVLANLATEMGSAAAVPWTAAPIFGPDADPVDSDSATGTVWPVVNPARHSQQIGMVTDGDAGHVDRALTIASAAAPGWDATPADARADILEKVADLYEAHTPQLLARCVQEAGKTLANAEGELREAVDFLRYYAARARADFADPKPMDGPTGEDNNLRLAGRGVFACISPWNFPLAIFTGQIAAALAAGNAVVAKPAEQTPLIAAYAVELFYQAGLPSGVLCLVPGPGETVGAALTSDPRVDGVAFTGSTDTARLIARALLDRGGPIVPLIAETGGMNAMIVDSSALTEQVVTDAVYSAFDSAGQRCSALRVLYLQDDIADRTIAMLAGAMKELRLGDPALLSTDVGPVIDAEAQAVLQAHIAAIRGKGTLIAESPTPDDLPKGTFVAPVAVEIEGIDLLEREVFGPVLHVVRYQADDLDAVLDKINKTGFGLTFGIHSRIQSTIDHVVARMRVGNVYVNRNIIGAIVGAQPFGGEGLSGTGPKAGGPHYLHRFAVERVVSTDTTAAGGNAALMAMED